MTSTSPPAESTYAPFHTVALAAKPNAPRIAAILSELAAFIAGSGYEVMIERDTAISADISRYPSLAARQFSQQVDAAIVLGGDGTMLGIARQLAGRDVPLIGINLGRLGFMTDIPLEEMVARLPDMLAGKYVREERTLLEAEVRREGETMFSALAFNDVVVNRSGVSGMAELAVSVDGHFMYNQRSDGLIVSTPTGSTAYALAAGGPILHPELTGIVLVPIAPHALSNRPIVLPHDVEVEIEVISGREVSVNFDMQSLTSLQVGDSIVVRRAPHTVTFLHPAGYNYYATLRKKLHWHEYPSERDAGL